jgi:hypothetical protein
MSGATNANTDSDNHSITRMGDALLRRRGDRIAMYFAAPRYVCFWHKADIARLSSNVRFRG